MESSPVINNIMSPTEEGTPTVPIGDTGNNNDTITVPNGDTKVTLSTVPIGDAGNNNGIPRYSAETQHKNAGTPAMPI